MGGKGRADLTNLPRKINICVSSTRDDFPHCCINDVGFEAVKNPAGEVVFNLQVRGRVCQPRGCPPAGVFPCAGQAWRCPCVCGRYEPLSARKRCARC